MISTEYKIRLAEQAVASHESKLATAADKDTVRRQIAVTKARLAALREEAVK